MKYESSLVGLPTGCPSSHSVASPSIFFVQIEQTRTFAMLANDGIVFLTVLCKFGVKQFHPVRTM